MTTAVTPETWQSALQAQHAEEARVADELAALAAKRRQLPRLEITTPYRFTGEDGEKTLADLFNGQQQLVTYHFMYGPDAARGCPFCTAFANTWGHPDQLREQGTEFALISRAPVEKLAAWKAEQGWEIPWYSAETQFSEDMGALPGGNDFSAINVFVRDGDTVYRTYYSSSTGVDTIDWQVALMNLTPAGGSAEG